MLSGGEDMKKLTLLIIPVLLLLFASQFVLAEKGDHNIRFGLKYIMPTADQDFLFSGQEDLDGTLVQFSEQATIEADAALGFGIGYEYMFTDLVGIDFNLNYAKHDVDAEGTDTVTIPGDPPLVFVDTFDENIGDTSLMPITVGVNFHVYQSDAMDFYLGPFVGYIMYDDLELNNVEPGESNSLSLCDDFGYGVAFGIDVPFGSKGWMFSSVLKYMQTKAEIDEPGTPVDALEIDINPVILQVGFGYKF